MTSGWISREVRCALVVVAMLTTTAEAFAQAAPAPIPARPGQQRLFVDEIDGRPTRVDATGGAQGGQGVRPGAPGAGAPAPLPVAPAAQPPPRAPQTLREQVQPAWRAPVSAPGQVSPGIRRFRYDRFHAMRVTVRVVMATLLALPACEVIDAILSGDSHGFEVEIVRDNQIKLFPLYAGIDTSVQVSTRSGNVYTFYVQSEPQNAQFVTDLTVFVESEEVCPSAPPTRPAGVLAVQGVAIPRATSSGAALPVIPGDGPGGTAEAQGRPAQALDPRQRAPAVGPNTQGGVRAPNGQDFAIDRGWDWSRMALDDYEVYGQSQADAALAPERVFHDGIFTYLDFGRAPRMRRGAVFLVEDGMNVLVNTRILDDGRFLVVEAVGDIALISGERVICIRFVGQRPRSPAVRLQTDRGRDDARQRQEREPEGWFRRWFGQSRAAPVPPAGEGGGG